MSAYVQCDARAYVRAYVRAPDVPKLNIPRSIHPGIAIKINGSPTLHTRLISAEVSVSFTIPLNRR